MTDKEYKEVIEAAKLAYPIHDRCKIDEDEACRKAFKLGASYYSNHINKAGKILNEIKKLL